MKVVVTSQPGMGHLNGLLALGRAMQAQGVEVWVAGAPSVVAHAARAGLRGTVVAPQPAGSDTPQNRALLARAETPEARLALLRSEVSIRHRARELLPGLSQFVADKRPDFIVRDSTELAGWVVAEAHGIPHVSFDVSAHWGVERWDESCGAAIRELRNAAGLSTGESPASTLYEFLHISNCPPSLLSEGDRLPTKTLSVRPEFFEGDGTSWSPRWPLDEGHLYLAFGSVYLPPRAKYSRFVIECSKFRQTIAVVERPSMPSRHLLGARYIPQTPVMPGCGLVVCHGGRSTVLTALKHGVPVLCLPSGSDHYNVSHAALRAGGGHVTSWGSPMKELLNGMRTAHSDAGLHASAHKLAVEIGHMDDIEAGSDFLRSHFA